MGLVAANLVNLRTHYLPECSLYLVGGSQGTECGVCNSKSGEKGRRVLITDDISSEKRF